MSDIVDTINRLEAWVRNYGHEKQPAFIADLRVLIGAAKAVSRAVDWLQKAQRYQPEEYSRMGRHELGGWMDAYDVERAIKILQEGQQ